MEIGQRKWEGGQPESEPNIGRAKLPSAAAAAPCLALLYANGFRQSGAQLEKVFAAFVRVIVLRRSPLVLPDKGRVYFLTPSADTPYSEIGSQILESFTFR